MFFRNEKSIKEFVLNYPVVTFLGVIYLLLWFITNILPFQIGEVIINWGIGFNAFILDGQIWRLFTATFLHGDFTHVLFNTFSLVLFGPALERIVGKIKFLLAYFTAGIVGNIASLFSLGLYEPHLGASGSIYGLFGVYLYMVWKRKDLISSTDAKLIKMISVIGIIMSIFQPRVNTTAHLFGAVGGFLIAPFVLNKAKRFAKRYINYTTKSHIDVFDVGFNPNRWQNKNRFRRIKLYLKYVLIGICILIALLILSKYVSSF